MSMGIQGRKILIVETEAGPRRQLRAGLSARGYDPEEVDCGLSALDRIDAAQRRTAPYACIIADAQLPDIDGLKLRDVIKSRYPSLPVILLTAGAESGVREAQGEDVGDGMLRKPLALDELARLMVVQPEPEHATVVDDSAAPSSASAYALVKLAPGAQRADVFRRLYFLEHVVYCDAVRGDHDLVLLLSAPEHVDLQQRAEAAISAIPGVEALQIVALRKPRISAAIAEFISQYERHHRAAPEHGRAAGEDQVLAYALVEVDNVELESTYPTLYFTEGVVSCDATRGGVDLVLLLQAPSFKQLERLVEARLRATRGVLRARLLPIIEMFRM